MGMVVRTNVSALNSQNNLNKNNNALSKSLEKLSSGYAINRAGDNASGLAISEKMKAQIKALDQASANAEDGVSLLQTAEGYLGEVHDMLNRMVELSEKSANGINEDSHLNATKAYGVSKGGSLNAGTDRAALQAEMDQLCAEIDRIALTANFNGNKLFNGNLADGDKVCKDDGSGFINAASAGAKGEALSLQIGETSLGADKLSVNLMRMTTDKLFKSMTKTDVTLSNGSISKGRNITIANHSTANTMVDVTKTGVTKGVASSWKSGLTINISDQNYASKAAELIRDAIDVVSLQRAQIGATQNRLEYTINNLNTASENMSAANSRIRDTDMAKEMTKYTQQNVLIQAAQSMLAQANSQPQGVLSLLQ